MRPINDLDCGDGPPFSQKHGGTGAKITPNTTTTRKFYVQVGDGTFAQPTILDVLTAADVLPTLMATWGAGVTYAASKMVCRLGVVYVSNIDGNIGNAPESNYILYTAWVPGTSTPWTQYPLLSNWMEFIMGKIFAS